MSIKGISNLADLMEDLPEAGPQASDAPSAMPGSR